MKYLEFAEKIEQVYKGKFPDSMIAVKPCKGFGRYIPIACYLAGDRAEFINGIRENDMLHISFMIDLPRNFDFESDELPESIILKSLDTSYAIKPENKYMYYGRRKIPYRKTAGTPEKLISAFGKFTERLYTQITADMESGNIHGNFTELLRTKI